MSLTVALDAMGGDRGPPVVVPAALNALSDTAELRLVLVGDEATLREELGRHRGGQAGRIEIRHASQQVEMSDLPSTAMRNKKDSSMRVALNLVKEGAAQACVSAGNTGALMATARFVLKTLPGIDRPAIISSLPSLRGHTHLLDLGANVESRPRHLLEFAVMGSVLASAVDNVEHPRVGLLNIGEEEIKGNDTVKEAARLLEQCDINYIGFVEGDSIYTGTADVIVCDGFVGNVALKSSEGVAKMIAHFIRSEFERSPLTRAAALVARPVLRAFGRRIDPRHYNGATLVGLRGIVVKSHGGADETAFARAIKVAAAEIDKDVPHRISERIAALLGESAEAV